MELTHFSENNIEHDLGQINKIKLAQNTAILQKYPHQTQTEHWNDYMWISQQ